MKFNVQLAHNDETIQRIIQLRYLILRQDWQQSIESATDELEATSYNAYIENENADLIACGRLQINTNNIGQIRFMAVAKSEQGKGYGEKILQFLEEKAKLLSLEVIELQARENALIFYEKQGYQMVEKTFSLWGQIQHFLMSKKLIGL